jgi:hypothetical protein
MVKELFRSTIQMKPTLGEDFKRELQERIEEELNRN